MKYDKGKFQVYSSSQANQCVIDLEKRHCTCRKWQLNEIPCKHGCAVIRFSGKNVEEYVHECYSIATYKAVYAHAIKPMSESDLWPQPDRVPPLPPPLTSKKVGRIRKLRRVNPIEVEDKGKAQVCKVRKYLCKICKEHGHNSRACKKRGKNVENPVVDQPAQEEFMDAPFNLFSQSLSQYSNITSSQNARLSQSAAPRVRRSGSNNTWRQPQPVMSLATCK
ncbi:hypothetical protein LIER_12828 [Lithospermum erythrorhizon]|uniref:SWIM-type domain-containing protein n=1 Tax=Lithospermum erythrorhizon TaxID=34254 RepID=A0AAV3PXQ4_LITER